MHPSFVRRARWLPLAAAALLLTLASLPATAADRDRDKGARGKKGESAAALQVFQIEFSDANDILLALVNDGRIGNDARFTDECAGFFPALSDNCYVFGSGIWVGGIVNGEKVVATGYDASLGLSEMEPGRSPERGNGADRVLCSTSAADLAQWYPEFSDATGQPIVFSQKDCVVIYHDANPLLDVFDPIGLEIEQRAMAFTFGLLSRVVFIVWDIENTSSDTVEEAFVAINADMDIGDAAEDDRCSAVPVVPPGPNNPGGETVETNLGICWDSNFNEVSFDPNPPGFVGITFFQGPVTDAGDTLGLTRFTLTTRGDEGRPQPDPNTDSGQYDLLAGIGTRAPFIDATSTDVRFVEISGPFTLSPGETQRVVVGYLFADVSNGRTSLDVSASRCFPSGQPCFLPDPNDPALEEVIRVQRAAQVIFDAAFLAPGPPPKPDITLIPGDQQVTVVWNDISGVPDPFFLIAGDSTNPAFDPLFREMDFEGYVLVRSTSGLTNDVDTLAVFDVVNDVVTIVDTTFRTFTIGDSVVELATDERTLIELPNTGLQFSFTDRGLINGILYFYDVAPFDFNPSNTLRGAEISLSSGVSFQPREIKSVRPRSDASSFQSANLRFETLKADGTVCDTDEPTATLDPATGAYTDFLDCSNAIVQATLSPLRDLNIPSGEFFFVVDSILPSETNHPYDGGYQIALGFNTVWYHWEDGSGSLAAAIQPNVGSFEQTFDFGHFGEAALSFGLDTQSGDVGPDLSIGLVVGSNFGALEDLAVNGQSLHLEELGGDHTDPDDASTAGERRPHLIAGSSLAETVVLGNVRAVANAREYSHPGPYAQGGTSYELTWQVSGGSYTGVVRRLPSGEEVPLGGQPKGPENPSTPADFIAGYNWGFITPGDPAAVQGAVFPVAGPLTNTISLNVGDTFAVFVPGQSVYIENLQTLPQDGDVWTFLVDTGSDRGFGFGVASGRDPDTPTPPFSYADVNDGGDALVPFARGIVNVFPGARWRLTIAGGSNDPADVDLARIKTVPDPYVVNAIWDFSQDNQRLEFTNLPPQCTIRLYTISGNLVRIIEHANGSGTEAWDLRTRFNLKVATGTYYWHVTTPDGRTALGLMSIIQNAPGAN